MRVCVVRPRERSDRGTYVGLSQGRGGAVAWLGREGVKVCLGPHSDKK